MRESLKKLAGQFGFVLMAASVYAVASNPRLNDYDSIAPRNIFNLREPVKTVEPVTNAPPMNLNLTGITTMLGNKLAMIRTHPPAKPGTPLPEETLMLT